jgi:hypothetical protein
MSEGTNRSSFRMEARLRQRLLPVACFPAAAGSPVAGALLHLPGHILADGDLGLIKDFVVTDSGAAECLTAGIHPGHNLLAVSGRAEKQDDGERFPA